MCCLQLATAVATAMLLWLAASSISSWHTAASMRSNIAALSQALDGSKSQIAALQQQLDSAQRQQNGQHSRSALPLVKCLLTCTHSLKV